MGQKRLRFGFDFLGTKVYAFRGGEVVDDRLHSPVGKEEITEEFERAIAMYVGNGEVGTRLIQYEEAGELLTFEVQVKPVETTRRLRPKTIERQFPRQNSVGDFSVSVLFWCCGVFIIGFFLTTIFG